VEKRDRSRENCITCVHNVRERARERERVSERERERESERERGK
jgi:hypothetical protein